MYDYDNIQDLLNEINRFVEDVNSIIVLRNNLTELMQEAFYLTCSNQQKSISVTVQTSDMPYRTTLVYQEEVMPENSNENTLNTDSLSVNYESYISNVNIPTITYEANEQFGVYGSNSLKPCVANVNGYNKHAYYVGTVNDKQKTLPENLFVTRDYDGLNIIDEDNNLLSGLFDFPIIDKVLNVNYICWSYFDKIPYYKKTDGRGNYVVDVVSMNGLLVANIINGNVINNRFNTQTLCGMDLNMSDDILQNEETYVEKRIILGYSESNVQNTISDFLRRIKSMPVTQSILDQINELFGTDLTIENISSDLSSIVYIDGYIREEDFIKYNGEYYYWNGEEYEIVIFSELDEIPQEKVTDFIVVEEVYYKFDGNQYAMVSFTEKDFIFSMSSENLINEILSFKKYIIDESIQYCETQYAPVLPLTTTLTIEDRNGCGVSEAIYANLKVKPSSNAVNDCKNGNRIFEFTTANGNTSDLVHYSVISLENADYPLNYAESNVLIKHITQEVKDPYSIGSEYNIFSYPTTSDYFKMMNL